MGLWVSNHVRRFERGALGFATNSTKNAPHEYMFIFPRTRGALINGLLTTKCWRQRAGQLSQKEPFGLAFNVKKLSNVGSELRGENHYYPLEIMPPQEGPPFNGVWTPTVNCLGKCSVRILTQYETERERETDDEYLDVRREWPGWPKISGNRWSPLVTRTNLRQS